MRCNASITTRALHGSSEAIGSSARMVCGPRTSARDRDALLLSVREIVGALRGEAGDVELLERGKRERLVLVRPELEYRAQRRRGVEAADQDVGQRAEPANRIELLEYHRRARPGSPPDRLAASIPPKRMHPAVGVSSRLIERSRR
jgi:hypothetical protein